MACTLRELGARACGWSAREARGRRQERGVGGRARGARGSTRVARVCAATGVLFTREHVLHPKSPK
ncbi:hypothetical protein CRG98_032169 [Punica granatum]|uniref:Uncharacterized protein n=1 Tax=Punica granatum TaxID=22663 RepID=A0A2I0ITU2_PUNGR|nr:hypothetical protein CRG98_032169 [Punica granatum]